MRRRRFCFRSLNDQDLFPWWRKIRDKGRFFFYAGAIDYHKNIDGLVRAFSRIKDKERH